MLPVIDAISGADEYVLDFKTFVLFDIWHRQLVTGLRSGNQLVYIPEYEKEDRYMTKNTNDLHRKLSRDMDRERFRKSFRQGNIRSEESNMGLKTIFKYVDTCDYRFETYFDDFRMIYPFDEKHSELMYEFSDKVSKSYAEISSFSPYQQAGLTFMATLTEMFNHYHISSEKRYLEAMMSLIGLSERTQFNAMRSGESITVDHVLRTSYYFQIHPYQLMGLRNIRYDREVKDKYNYREEFKMHYGFYPEEKL